MQCVNALEHGTDNVRLAVRGDSELYIIGAHHHIAFRSDSDLVLRHGDANLCRQAALGRSRR